MTIIGMIRLDRVPVPAPADGEDGEGTPSVGGCGTASTGIDGGELCVSDIPGAWVVDEREGKGSWANPAPRACCPPPRGAPPALPSSPLQAGCEEVALEVSSCSESACEWGVE